MATVATPVPKDVYDKNPEKYQTKTVEIEGVGPTQLYFEVERRDDVTGKAGDGIETVRLTVPTLVKDEDNPENPPFYGHDDLELDVSPESYEKLRTALAPFIKNARPVPTRITSPSRSGGKNPQLAEWNARAKEWLRKAGHEVPSAGRLSQKLIEIYATNNPDDPRPE